MTEFQRKLRERNTLIRELLVKGFPVKAVAFRVGVSESVVYNVRDGGRSGHGVVNTYTPRALSQSTLEVKRLYDEGYRRMEIAEKLGMSVSNVGYALIKIRADELQKRVDELEDKLRKYEKKE